LVGFRSRAVEGRIRGFPGRGTGHGLVSGNHRSLPVNLKLYACNCSGSGIIGNADFIDIIANPVGNFDVQGVSSVGKLFHRGRGKRPDIVAGIGQRDVKVYRLARICP